MLVPVVKPWAIENLLLPDRKPSWSVDASWLRFETSTSACAFDGTASARTASASSSARAPPGAAPRERRRREDRCGPLVLSRDMTHPVGSRLSALGSRLSALGSRLSALGSRLSALGSRLSALGSRLSALGSRLSALGSRLSALGSRLSALGSRLSALYYGAAIRARLGLRRCRSGPDARRRPEHGRGPVSRFATRRAVTPCQAIHSGHSRLRIHLRTPADPGPGARLSSKLPI